MFTLDKLMFLTQENDICIITSFGDNITRINAPPPPPPPVISPAINYNRIQSYSHVLTSLTAF
jgi:hypothetical protein